MPVERYRRGTKATTEEWERSTHLTPAQFDAAMERARTHDPFAEVAKVCRRILKREGLSADMRPLMWLPGTAPTFT